MKSTLFALSLLAAFTMSARALDDTCLNQLRSMVQSTIGPDVSIGQARVNRVSVSGDTLVVDLAANYAHNTFTPELITQLKSRMLQDSGVPAGTRHVQLTIAGDDVDNYFFNFDKRWSRRHAPFVSENDPARHYSKGLDGNIIAMWQSHGYYYEAGINHWEWQRPRLFETHEDLYPMSYVIPFVMPMLENAGAYVWNPRERDTHATEVIVDNDGGLAQCGYVETGGKCGWQDAGAGFAYKQRTYLDCQNPFASGTARQVEARRKPSSTATWSARVPEAGDYAVYISYKTLDNSVDDAQYTVNCAAGRRTFTVNQRMAGGVWVYLGTFPLKQGLNKDVVTLTNQSRCKHGVVTADAVKIGGGMGNIARTALPNTPENRKWAAAYDWHYTLQRDGVDYAPVVSGMPRYVEGARYFLQWSGFPDSVYTVSRGLTDYADDFRSRSEWVNYLSGGSQANPAQQHGLHVPLDLSMAFHTDAGVTAGDRIVGTQSIYRSNHFGNYADGTPRIISRRLAEMVNAQLVADMRAQFEPHWTDRGLTQENLYEIRVPQVPGMLLEYLSHQNFADMRYGLDPNFIFASSRAIYKGILRWIAARDHRQIVVQPLPVQSFAIVPLGNARFKLTWAATPDSLEPTAMPKRYIVAERVGDNNGFAEIAIVDKPEYMVTVTDSLLHSYRVTALNDGGRSFPSETLSLGIAPRSKGMVMVVNGFTRLSAPDWVDDGDYCGFTDETDHGVPYVQGINYIGSQYERRRSAKWRDDDSGGWGNSHSDYEGKVVAGNTFDFPALHGASIMRAGYSFVSTSVKAVEQGLVDLKGFKLLDYIAGKQKETKNGRGYYPSRYKIFTPALRHALTAYCNGGGSVLLTGSYVASDVYDKAQPDTAEMAFTKQVLGYRWGCSQATVTGQAYVLSTPFKMIAGGARLAFNQQLSDKWYCVESPDAVYSAGGESVAFMRYAENNKQAGILCNRGSYRTAVVGFPFESIVDENERDTLMSQLLQYLDTK